MDFLNNSSGYDLAIFASIFAIFLSQGLTPTQMDTLAGFLAAVGTNLSIIATSQVNNPDFLPPIF